MYRYTCAIGVVLVGSVFWVWFQNQEPHVLFAFNPHKP